MKVVRCLILFFCLALGVYFSFKAFSHSQEDVIGKALKRIPPDEKMFLEFFFREVLLRESGAYVLNGTKPATWTGFFEPEYYGSTLIWRAFKKDTLLRRGCEIWKKYQNLFPSPCYAFCYANVDEDLFDILLINKRLFLSEVAENIEDFKAVLGSEITPEILLDRLIKERIPLSEALNGHQALLGIVLGYGRHNSWLFHHRDVVEKRINAYQFVPKRSEFIEEEFCNIQNKFQPFDKKRKNRLIFASLPAFVFDPKDPTTQELLKKYGEERKKLTQFYGNGNFLETTLKKLTDS